MKIRSINKRSIAILRNAFSEYLLENAVAHKSIGLVQEDGKLALLVEREQALSVFRFDERLCIDQEASAIAKEVIDPVLARLKEQ